MTHRQFYEYLLTELNTVKAPSLHLEDFLYFGNKGIQEYVNERYRKYQDTQQLTDDLQALHSSTSGVYVTNSSPATTTFTGSFSGSRNTYFGNKYNSAFMVVGLPSDYFHLLSCNTSVQTNIPYKCQPAGYIHQGVTKRLTSDLAVGIMNNAFLKPDYRTTYYKIVDDYRDNIKPGAIEIYYGDPNKFSVTEFNIDYLKQPALITMTATQRDAVTDNTPQMEFPEYVCNEIIKRTVKLILENQQNPRLQTHIPTNESIE